MNNCIAGVPATLVIVLACGCGGAKLESQVPEEHWTSPSSAPPAKGSQEEASAEERPQIATLAEAVEACRSVQNSDRIPVGCDVKYVDGVPSMIVAFGNVQDAERYYRPMAERVAAPFCAAADSSNRRAQIVEAVANQFIRSYDCELEKWTDWRRIDSGGQPASDPVAEEQESPDVKALRTCAAVQQSNDIPMQCEARIFEGVPSLIFGFQTMRDALRYLDSAQRIIAAPFCASANASGQAADVYVRVGREARMLHCAGNSWSPWVRIDDGPQPRQPSRPGGQPTIRTVERS